MKKLSNFCLACVLFASSYVFAGGEKGFSGAYVNDPDALVQPGSYFAISSVYNGHRYYLGVDTTAAKSGVYKVATYSAPCYATMWWVGGLFSPTGAVLPDKDYLRTYKSVYLLEKHSQTAYLALGTQYTSYHTMTLATDTANATFWHSDKTRAAKNRYLEGYIYYYSDATGIDVYRYLAYDALYGFDRAYSTPRPTATMWATVWHRVEGDNLSCNFSPATYWFNYNRTNAESQPYTFTLRLEEGGVRFQSLYDGTAFYAVTPTITNTQSVLNERVSFTADWKSTHGTANSNKSYFTMKETYYDENDDLQTRPKDSLMMTVGAAVTFDAVANNFTGTITTAGRSPKNIVTMSDQWLDHQDYLHMHINYNDGVKTIQSTDSVLVTRRTYKEEYEKQLNGSHTPFDHMFPYFDVDSLTQPYIAIQEKHKKTFTVSAQYEARSRIINTSGTEVYSHVERQENLNLAAISEEIVDGKHLNKLLFNVYLADGVTPADWIESVTLSAPNQITVEAKPYNTSATSFRVAMLKYSYTYITSSVKTDTVRMEGIIWLTQEPQKQPEGEGLIKFSHQTGKSGLPMVGDRSRQQVPELTYTYYTIPEVSNNLPIHHDHWGYYRWFIYKNGANVGRDIENNWDWTTMPTNAEVPPKSFGQINIVDSKWSRGLFEMSSKLNPSEATHIPAVKLNTTKLGGGATAINFDDTLGVDISTYTDTLSVGVYNNTTNNLTSLTEPTLSYRQLFAMRPAKERADRMAECLLGNSSDDYIQNEACFAPIGRPFQLQPSSPYKLGKQVDEGNLQYVYYFNPNENDNLDPDMGTATGLDLTIGKSYRRIGTTEHRYTGDTVYHAQLLDLSQLKTGDSTTVVMVCPVNNGYGYILGKENEGFTDIKLPTSVDELAKIKDFVEDTILNTASTTDAFKMTLIKTSDGITIENDDKYITFSGQTAFLILAGYFGLGWTDQLYTGDSRTLVPYAAQNDNNNYITNTKNSAYRLYMYAYRPWTLFNREKSGYLTAMNSSGVRRVDINSSGDPVNAAQAWLFYEIIEPKERVDHPNETTVWQRKIGEKWQNNGNGWNGTELDGGALQVTDNASNNGAIVEYRLVSDHFQLAHFAVTMRPAEGAGAQGPSTTALITEDEIEQNYDVLASFGLEETLGAPGTSEMVSPYYHLQFNHTQFAYHYPVGTAVHEIPAAQRVTGSDILPANGEYCIINKFEKAGYQTVEAGGGAEHGWMFCYNRASKPLVFIDFEYPKPACTDQDLVLVSNFCKPSNASQENPHVKAEFFGHVPGTPDTAWVKIFTYLTGNFIQAGAWYQLALPLRWSQISGFDKYRCVGTLNAAEGNGAYVLFDRFRLLGKRHAVTGFQKRTTCIDNDSIYLITRIDYTSLELNPGDVICYQFQKWDNTQDKYVPMITSDYNSATDTYTCRPDNTTEVYPGYYKIGMTKVESVTNKDFKSLVLNSDYGTVVVPETNYNPTLSGTSAGWSTARSNAIDYIQTLIGDDRSSYKNETGRIKQYSDIMTAQKFDFGERGKFYVNEGTDANPHWVIYIIARVNVNSTQNGTFRIALTSVDAVNSKPNFSDAACSNARVVRVQGSVDMLIDGATGWPNKDRATLTSEGNLIPANTTKTLSLLYNEPNKKEGTTTECRFDLVRAFAFMDGYIDMTPEQQAAADLEWLRIYGCTVGDFQEAMNVFRADDPANPNRKEMNWANVTKESFRWLVGEHYTQAHADSMYNILNRLIVHDRLMEVGMSSRDISLGNEQDLYFYIRPIAASGVYTTLTKDGSRDSIAEGIICNAPIWLELHSAASPDSLRFGYDKKFGDSFAIPVIRATKTAANSALSVRVAAISDHAAIGWDSTHVVESNDPEWNRRMATLDNKPTFRYTQDRIVQERLYSGYYQQDQAVIFRPVDAAHITRLNRTDCECLNYDATGTTYDPAKPRAKDDAGTNVFIRPAASPINGCNEWHVLPQTSDPSPKNHTPGYQIPNNFELKAGYWYKFKTTFFNTGSFISYNIGDNPSGANTAFFILAVVPDTVRWTPHYDDRTNYWNDDNNWTPVVNGADFNGSLATVPLEDSRAIIEPLADQSYLPVVNYDSLGLKEWGFKTATCKDILFKHHSQILGQEKLTYTGKAFIDVIINQGNWQTFSPALKNVYSGDIYIPENTANDKDFLPEVFETGSAWGDKHNRTWPYAFYQAYYNSTVPLAFQNTDKDGALDTDTKVPKNSAEWVKTNVLDQPLVPGKAVALLGFGPTDEEGTELIVRLPKQETSYHYIGKNAGTWTVGSEVTLSRAAFEDISGNLEYDKATLGDADGVVYPLTNALESKVFFFGNPTMSLIDVYRLCEDNITQLEYSGDANHTYSFTTYNMKDGSTYMTETVNGPGKVFIAPQRAVGLIASSARTTLNIKLKPSALVALSAGGELVHNVTPGAKKSQVVRKTAAEEPVQNKLLYIAASNETNKGLYKAYITLGESNVAARGFRKGEDAISLSSGGTYYNSTAFSTPLSMYTIADNQPLMLDMRDSIFSVPLVFATLDTVTNSNGVRVWSKYSFDNITRLSFAMEGNWDKALYLYDALTGDSIMIVNGLQLGIPTPESDQIRYFINGGRHITTPVVTPDDPGVVTGTENVNGETESPLNNNQSTVIYDILGRRVKVLGEYELLKNVKLPVGVYIIQRGNQTEKVVMK